MHPSFVPYSSACTLTCACMYTHSHFVPQLSAYVYASFVPWLSLGVPTHNPLLSYTSVCVCLCVNIPLSSHRVGGGVCTYIPLLPSLSGQSIHLGSWRFKVLVPFTQMGFELGHFYFPGQHFNHQTVCQVWCQLGTFCSISLSLEV